MTTTAQNGGTVASTGRRLVELDPAEALRLLASVDYGRVVFTLRALPAIRPVNHLVDAGQIIIRTRLTSRLATVVTPTRSTVVASQTDLIDPTLRVGWSVVVTGIAHPVTDPAQITRFEQTLTPWVDMTMDTVLRIRPEIISGFRLVDAGQPQAPAATTG
jgi:Pyridoxamine 5'-phosphate oxidase